MSARSSAVSDRCAGDPQAAAWCDPQVRGICALLHDGLVPMPVGVDTSVVGVWQRQFPLTTGVVDDRAVQAMTNGQCLALAVALCHRTGWPIAALMDHGEGGGEPDDTRSRDDQMTHLGVLSPDGTAFIDICGARRVDDVLAQYRRDFYGERAEPSSFGIQVVDADWLEFMLHDPHMRRPAMRVAVTFVDPVLMAVHGQLPAVPLSASSPTAAASDGTTATGSAEIVDYFRVYRCDPELVVSVPALQAGEPSLTIAIAVLGGGTLGRAYAKNHWVYAVHLGGDLVTSGADLHSGGLARTHSEMAAALAAYLADTAGPPQLAGQADRLSLWSERRDGEVHDG